jgi:hypothetical protein
VFWNISSGAGAARDFGQNNLRILAYTNCPLFFICHNKFKQKNWIPAFAGMTGKGAIQNTFLRTSLERGTPFSRLLSQP